MLAVHLLLVLVAAPLQVSLMECFRVFLAWSDFGSVVVVGLRVSCNVQGI